MRKIVLVSRCRGKAKATTRSVIDAYASRIGDETWATHISEQGIAQLRSELLASATRRTAISSHVVENGRINLRWIIGRRDMFGTDGTCPTKTSAKGHKSLTQPVCFPFLSQFLPILSLAALAHDFGKNNKDFAAKLAAQEPKADPVRHEVISTVFLAEYLDGGPAPANIKNWGDFTLPAVPTNKLSLLKWLCYTHHRLPAAEITGFCTTAEHVKDRAYAFHPNHPQPIRHDAKVDAEWDRLAASFAKVSLEFPAERAVGLFIYGRLAIMLADHYVSSERELIREEPGLPMANSSKPGRAPQDLALHNIEVSAYSRRALCNAIQLPHLLPKLEAEDLEVIQQQARGRFAWQNAAAKIMDDIPKTDGAIIMLTAETGQGKTRAAFRMMSGPTGQRRLTVTLGLRTLTLQTGDAYRQQFNLPATHLKTIIASREVQQLHRALDQSDTVAEPMIEPGAFMNTELPDVISFTAGQNKAFLTTPVVVSTIDYLIEAGNYGRSRHLLPTLRLLSSDVIIDEVDDYSLDDIPAVARLIFLTAAFGRRVLLSSATLCPEIATDLVAAYHAGWRIHTALGFSGIAHLVVAHNRAQPKKFVLNDDTNEALRTFSNSIAEKLPVPPHRKAEFVKIQDVEDVSPIVAAVQRYHSQHKCAIAGRNVSIGLIRISHTKHAAAVYERLVNSDALQQDAATLVLLYHRRIPLFVRTLIEKDLDEVLTVERRLYVEVGAN